ncbi:ATP-binding protein [Methylorubrum sp. SB2]|uniref:ATP-binding protein n=1 Tax=Methylorubrum subtropicum TaxID=3138812 RepID=UPI00313F0142
MATARDNWSDKVGAIFDVRPRVAIDDRSRWIAREEEDRFRRAILSPGMHAILYGPSGSGKTSLAKSTVGRIENKERLFIYTRINHNTDWNSFKSQIIENKNVSKSGEPLSYKIGLRNLLPYIEVGGRKSFGVFSAAADRQDLVSKIAIHHISQFMIDKNVCLVVDDANFATNELMEMLTSLAKEITDNSNTSNSKVVFVGANDIYNRVMALNDSLMHRTREISLGSIGGEELESSNKKFSKAFHFIADGLKDLGLEDPRDDRFIKGSEFEEMIKWVRYAADGLPKSIVALGQEIAETGFNRKRVSSRDIINCSQEMVTYNFRKYRTKYRALFSIIKKHQISQQICLWMFKKGASSIYSKEEVCEDLAQIATYTMIDEAITYLDQAEFLVVTGEAANVFFARDPLLAHTIGVAMIHSEVGTLVGQDYFKTDKNAAQLLLQFVGDKDPENKSKI